MSTVSAEEITVTSFGGIWETAITNCFAAEYEKRTGHKANVMIGSPAQWMSQIEANPDNPPIDVIVTTQSQTVAAGEGGLISRATAKEIPNLADVDPLFINGPALDFSLRWDSFAIDGGNPEDIADEDGTVMDMGAFPYDQTLQPPDAVTSFSGMGGNGYITLEWGYPMDPRGNANGDIVDLVLMRAVADGLFDTLAVLPDTDTNFTDLGEDAHLINGQEYHYVMVSRDTSNLHSLINDTLTLIPIGGIIALNDSDTTNDFGSVDHDQTSVWELRLENTGNGELNLGSIEVSSAWYDVSVSSMSIPAGESDTLLVTFDPDLTPGSLMDTIVINTDDLDAPVIEIELFLLLFNELFILFS